MPDGNRKIDLPLQTRLAPVDGIDQAARTASVVWSTGARVKRREWLDWDSYQDYWEELSLDPAHVRMGRLASGTAPVLNAHNRWSLDDQIGVVESATLVGGEGRAVMRFSQREEVKPIFQDIADKIIRNVSVGYAVYKIEKLPPDERSEGLPIKRAIDWEPHEISPVPVGADAGAGIRSEQVRVFACEVIDVNPADSATTRKEVHMDEATRAAEEAAKKKAADELAAQQRAENERAADAERSRIQEITARCEHHKLPAAFRDALIKDKVTFEAACVRILDEVAKGAKQVDIRSGFDIETVRDEVEVRRAGAVEALLHRYDPGNVKLTDNGKQFRGMTLRELMRDCLEVKGVRTRGMSVNEMWERTFLSGSDLPNIVLDAANKSLRAAYDAVPRTFTQWCRQTSAPDFKNINRIALSGAPSLTLVLPGGEFKRGIMTDSKESYALLTYGKIVAINRQTIVNDDMDAFTRVPALMARAASDLEADTVYSIITTNANLSDGGALFNATAVTTAGGHANLTSSGTAINVDNLGVARASMRKQVGIEGRPINVVPKFLIVPAAKETLAEQYTSADFVSAKSSDINVFRSGRPSALTVVAEPRLDANSGTAWYLAADPGQIDTVEYAYLEGQQGVYLETRMGFDIDGMEIKVRDDFAAKAIDYRGLYKNNGA